MISQKETKSKDFFKKLIYIFARNRLNYAFNYVIINLTIYYREYFYETY